MLAKDGFVTLSLRSDKTEDTVVIVAERLLSRGLVSRDRPVPGRGPTYRITMEGKEAIKDYLAG